MNERPEQPQDRPDPCVDEALLLTQFAADHAPDAVYWIDDTARFVYVNDAACRSLDYTRDELLQLSVPDIDPTWPKDRWRAMWEELRVKGASTFETVHQTKHGRIFPVEIRANFIEYGGRSLDCAYARDISERKRTENTVRESAQMLKLVLDTIPVAVWWKDRDSVYLGCNRLFAANAGLASPDDIVGKTDFDLPWKDSNAQHYRAADREVLDTGTAKLNYEETQLTKDGVVVQIRTSKVPLRNANGEVIGVLGTFEDITERRKAERALRSTQFAVDNMSEVAMWVTPDARFVYANNAATELLGYSKDELLAMTVFDINADFVRDIWPAHWEEVRAKRTVTVESILRAKDGRLIPAEIRANFVEFEGKQYHYTFVRDISERKAAELALRKANRTLAALSRVNEILVRATEESELLNAVCDAVVEAGGYVMAWVGFAEGDGGKTVRPVAHAGSESGYLSRVAMSWADDVWGQCPAGTAIRTGKLCVVRDVLSEPSYAPWREDAAQRGYGCSVSLPLVIDSKPIGALCLYGAQPGCPDQEEEQLLIQLASDLSYGIASLRARHERRAAEEERRALEQRLEDHKRKFYRETILSVTDGKLDISDSADVRPYLTSAEARISVEQASDVMHARQEVQAFLAEHGLAGEDQCAFMIGVGEAITNALKHGGRGRVYVGTTNGDVWVCVRDRGSGIESLILPRAVLRRGFSTKPSLGLGYSIMLDVADHILLKTGAHGTTVVLIKFLNAKPIATLDSIPDTWETIPDLVS